MLKKVIMAEKETILSLLVFILTGMILTGSVFFFNYSLIKFRAIQPYYSNDAGLSSKINNYVDMAMELYYMENEFWFYVHLCVLLLTSSLFGISCIVIFSNCIYVSTCKK
jgi:hypothetical protein